MRKNAGETTRAYRYFIVFKPFGMLSQFSQEAPGQNTLADLNFDFPKDVYPVGRLDADSEGLLLLTNDKTVNAKLLNPKNAHPRTYLAQVEGIPTVEALEKLRGGLDIRIAGKIHRTRPATIQFPRPNVHSDGRAISPSDRLGRAGNFSISDLPERNPPVRFRKTVPDAWLEITLTEGKNRQVRRMCAAAGLPVLRLVRIEIGNLGLGSLQPGEVRELDAKQFQSVL